MKVLIDRCISDEILEAKIAAEEAGHTLHGVVLDNWEWRLLLLEFRNLQMKPADGRIQQVHGVNIAVEKGFT